MSSLHFTIFPDFTMVGVFRRSAQSKFTREREREREKFWNRAGDASLLSTLNSEKGARRKLLDPWGFFILGWADSQPEVGSSFPPLMHGDLVECTRCDVELLGLICSAGFTFCAGISEMEKFYSAS